ncbi:UDP-N-acetylglucosamine 4,6-dehydratase [Catenovulum sp. SX2]|uniref:UDP-N-acetylglucosamine 4,6-dehydratase n=1 Tax=Catenovulum sp. SX2 TaxID=3398614 RepID=UPI003F872354
MNTSLLSLIGRNTGLFEFDLEKNSNKLLEIVSESSFLVLGGAGTIGQAVTKEIFKRSPKKLHVVDISENNMVELVRDIRSSFGYIEGEFRTLILDIGSLEFDRFIEFDGQYDYVLNLSAMKHVRSERDPYTLMRMLNTNVLNTQTSLLKFKDRGTKKYFCVSTDKAANPVNLMGATKRLMEKVVGSYSKEIDISMARFANVAFSDGSLLYGFEKRLSKRQPIAAPRDIKRYFMTSEESGVLCLMSCLLGYSGDIFFPKLDEKTNLITFADIAKKYLKSMGLEPFECENELESRAFFLKTSKADSSKWPCVFSDSDTTGEKPFEEFFVDGESVDLERYLEIGVVANSLGSDEFSVTEFELDYHELRQQKLWSKRSIVEFVCKYVPEFSHLELDKYLDQKM